MTNWTDRKRLRGLLFFGIFLLTGCGIHQVKYVPVFDQRSTGELPTKLEEGNRLFREGSYKAAEAVFQSLQQSNDPVVVRQALYGLACSRFMLAENRQEYLDAVTTLTRWEQMSPDSLEQEDPRMLLLLFTKALYRGPADNPEGSSTDETHSLLRLFDYKKKIDDLEARIACLEKEIATFEKQKTSEKAMKDSMQAMEKTLKEKEDAARAMAEELSKLRDQIKTMETIDQEIQEKKQGISPQ